MNPAISNIQQPRVVSARMLILALLGMAVAATAFALGVRRDPAAAWRALLVNFLYWTTVAQGALMWAVTFRLARTTWSAPLNRLGHCVVWFLGCSIFVLAGLYFGRAHYLPWIHLDLGDRARWLNVPSLFIRDGIGLLALFLLGLAFVHTYFRHDMRGASRDVPRVDRRLAVLGVLLALAYIAVSTLLALDLVMSLVPEWHHTLFGWYYSLGGLYAGMASLIVMTVLLRRWLGIAELIGRQQFQDLGNLLLAFAMAMTYFFFAQALTIWYENLPPETIWAIPRVNFTPWRAQSWALIGVCYLGPFALLVIREIKENHRTLFGVALLVLLAMWYERYLLIEPSLSPRSAGFPVLVPLIGVGFLGMFVLTAVPLLARHPAVSQLDLALTEERRALS